MTTTCRKYCLEAIHLADMLIQLARNGNDGCDHDACLVLFGILLDTGSRIRRDAVKRLGEIDAGDHERKTVTPDSSI
jgi:hypothetical protein